MENFEMKSEKEILKEIAKKNVKDNKWTKAEFETIKNMDTTTKGNIAEQFVDSLCKEKNIMAFPNPKKKDAYDIKIFNKTVEIKMATEDTNGKFQFNGIRYHRDYEYLLVLGISPNNIYFNFYPSSDIKSGKIGKLVTMEKGTVASNKLTQKKEELHCISQFEYIIKNATKEGQIGRAHV